MNVTCDMFKIRLLCYSRGEIATLKQWSNPFVCVVKVHTITSENCPHEVSYGVQVLLIDEKMDMVRHERIRNELYPVRVTFVRDTVRFLVP